MDKRYVKKWNKKELRLLYEYISNHRYYSISTIRWTHFVKINRVWRLMKLDIDKKILGKYIAAIKGGKTDDHCSLSLLLTIGHEHDYYFPSQEFWDNQCQPLIDTYQTNKNWNDVLTFILS